MKDNFLSDELSSDMLNKMRMSASKPMPGMRHSIRRRKMAGTQAQKRMDELRNSASASMTAAPEGVAVRKVQPAAKPAARIQDKTPAPDPAETAPAAATPVTVAPVAQSAPVAAPKPQWSDLPLATSGTRRALTAAMPVVDAARNSDAARAFDLLRTKMRQTTQEKGWVNIGITAPTSGCGNTFTAVNLALSLSRVVGSRTVLMDMNLRRPGVAAAFDMQAPGAIGDYLTGHVDMVEQMVRASDSLALGLSDQPDENAAEVLQDPNTMQTLDAMRASLDPQLVIYDLPPMLAHDDVSAFLPQLDGILLVSDGTQTMGRQLVECERMLDGKVPLLGVVLNRARSSSISRYK